MESIYLDKITVLLPTNIRESINKIINKHKITQIKIKCGRKILIYINGACIECDYTATKADIDTIISRITQYSPVRAVSSFSKGYTSFCGVRIGFIGEAMEEYSPRVGFKSVLGLCIRIPHEVIGCAEGVSRAIIKPGGVANTLIISPPGGGKTTLLRDILRLAGNCFTCAVADERGEICALVDGSPTMDVGKYTDILNGFGKNEALYMAIRNLSPRAVFTDEIGSAEDARALYDASTMGVGFVATAHGNSLEDVLKRDGLRLLAENSLIDYAITLSSMESPGVIEGVKRILPCGKV